MIQLAVFMVTLFGLFLIGVGILMLINPSKARSYLRKAGSTNLINYSEITIRMIPAAALIISAEVSRFTLAFEILGWFMISTSLILYFVPRTWHHQYAQKCADLLQPKLIQLISPFSMIFGYLIMNAVLRFA